MIFHAARCHGRATFNLNLRFGIVENSRALNSQSPSQNRLLAGPWSTVGASRRLMTLSPVRRQPMWMSPKVLSWFTANARGMSRRALRRNRSSRPRAIEEFKNETRYIVRKSKRQTIEGTMKANKQTKNQTSNIQTALGYRSFCFGAFCVGSEVAGGEFEIQNTRRKFQRISRIRIFWIKATLGPIGLDHLYYGGYFA